MEQTKVFYILYKRKNSDFDVASCNFNENENFAQGLAKWQKQNNTKIVLWRGYYKDNKNQIEFEYYFNYYKEILIDEMLKQVKTYRNGNIINFWDKSKKSFVKIDVTIFNLFAKFVN